MSAQAAPTPAEIIAKAREKVGGETQLASVKTIILQGDAYDKDGKKVAFTETKLKAPNMRREYVLSTQPGENGFELISASNGLEGFAKIVRGRTHQTKPFGLQDITRNTDRLHAEISFFAAPAGGSVTFDAEVLQQGKTCNALLYKYKGGTHIRRFFDKQTGQLVAEESYYEADTPQNKRILTVFEGEISPAGSPIHFPRKITRWINGEASRIEYSKVIVNEAINDSDFAFPMP
ncbi:MAG: hypothetical protein LBG65_03145 [Puniceicoccales bacterium]|nr:hypothetical protein [Puniceicoccales bacterium]